MRIEVLGTGCTKIERKITALIVRRREISNI